MPPGFIIQSDLVAFAYLVEIMLLFLKLRFDGNKRDYTGSYIKV